MSEVILVVLQRPETAAMLLRAAGRLAMLAGGARVSALAMQTPLGLTSLMGDGSIPEEMLAGMQADERKRLALLKEIFDGLIDREGRRDLANACFRFLPMRARLDLLGWDQEEIFAH